MGILNLLHRTSNLYNKNQTHCSPPRKKIKPSKMGDTRESLGDFDSSLLDADDGHILVDLIRRKKGIHVQTQKIFDDVPSHRPSLQIEIQRLDQENEENLYPNKHSQEAALEANIVNNNELSPPNTEFVPKSPLRKSAAERRSITSPIIKMNSTTLGRRTLLKEFEKAFLHESRFNPEICSTPISSDFSNHRNAKDVAIESSVSKKKSPQEHIICSPITISDEGSPADQTLKESSRSDIMMRSLINQNELLNALVQQSSKDQEDTLVNRNSPERKSPQRSPRRTFTVECDVSSGKIILSPAKSKQNALNDQKTPTKKLISTPEQRKLLTKLGLNLGKGSSPAKIKESAQKSSRIPILSNAKNANAIVQQPCLTNQESTTTAEFVERLQKNATPNCPVIVIPVNQTFNQAPPPNPTITNDISRLASPPLNEIPSNISDNTPKSTDFASIQKETHTEPPIINLRWDDIITDDASSPEKEDARKPASKSDVRQISKSKNSQKQNSITNVKKKLSLSYKCLDLRMRADSDEKCEKPFPHKSQRMSSKIDEQQRTEDTNNLNHQSRRGTYIIEKQYHKELGDNLPERSREASKANEQFNTEHENSLEPQPRRGASRISEHQDHEQNLAHRSRRKASKFDSQCYEKSDNHLQQRSRGPSKIYDTDSDHDLPQQSRDRDSRIEEQVEDDRETNLVLSSRKKNSYVDERRCTQRQNHLQERSRERASKNDEQFEEVLDHDLPHRTRRQNSLYNEQSDKEHESSPKRVATKTDDRQRKRNTKHRSRRETSQIDKQHEHEQNLPQRSQMKISSETDEQQSKQHEKILPRRSRKKTCVSDVQSDEESDHNIPQQPAHRPSKSDEQRSQQRLAKTSKTHEQHEALEQNLPRRSRRNTSVSDFQSDEERDHSIPQQPARRSSETDEQRSKQHQNILPQRSHEHEHNLPRRSRKKAAVQSDEESDHNIPQQPARRPSKSDEQRGQQRLAKTSKTHEQHDALEQNLPRRFPRNTYVSDVQSDEERDHNIPQQPARRPSETDEQRSKQHQNILPQRSHEHEHNLPRRSRKKAAVQSDEESGHNIPQQPARRPSKSDEHRSQQHLGKTSKTHEQHGALEQNLPRRSRKNTSVSDVQSDEESDHNIPQQPALKPSKSDEQRSQQRLEKTSKTHEQHEALEHNLPRRSRKKAAVPDVQSDEESEHNIPQQSLHGPSETDEHRSKQCKNILPQRPLAKKSRTFEQHVENHEHHLTHQSSQNNFEVPVKSREDHNLQQKSHIVEQRNKEVELNSPQRFPRDISKIDQQRSQLRQSIQCNSNEIESFSNLPPPDEFRDIDSNLQCTNSISNQKDLLDEQSSDRVVLSQDTFKRPSEVINKIKKQRKPKTIPKDVKEYLEASQKVARTQYLNISKRKLYSKGHSDLDSSDSINTPQKLPRKSAKSRKSKNVDMRKEPATQEILSRDSSVSPSKTRRTSRNDSKVSHKESKQNSLSMSRRRYRRISSSSSDRKENSRSRIKDNNSGSNVDTNITERSPVSTIRTSNISKNSEQTKKKGKPTKNNNKGVESNLENIAKKKNYERVDNLIFHRRSSSDSSSDNEKSSKQTNQHITRETHDNKEKHITSDSSSSIIIDRISQKTNESKSKSNHNEAESNLEDITSASQQLFLSHIKKPLTSVVNEDVEGNVEKDTPTKSRSKKKIYKKNKKTKVSLECEYKPRPVSTMEQPEDCGLRRSKRERKAPTAYWACSDSQFTHVNDIYTMLTAGKKPYFPEFLIHKPKKDKTKLPSTDDNLVANTNTVDSSSKKGKNKTKQQSKQKNKTAEEPKATENRDFQSESETETNINKPSHSSIDKNNSHIISKSKKKTKEKLIVEERSVHDTDSNVETVLDNLIHPRNNPKTQQPSRDTDPSSSGYATEKEDISDVRSRRLTTIAEDGAQINNQSTTSVAVGHKNKTSGSSLMPPPKTNIVKRVNKTKKNNAFHTEHDESIADVSSVHVNYLFEQLKNSSINNTMVNRSRLAKNSSGQVSLDSNTKRSPSNSVGKTKNVSVRLQRLNFNLQGTYDSGFSSEDKSMISVSSKKDILLDWLVQMINNGKTPLNNEKGLGRFLQPNGFRTANADELTFEEIDGIDFAFYNSPGQKFGYLRFKPRTEKKLSCAKRYELNFVLLGGTIRMTVDKQTFDMNNGDLTTIFIGTSYRMRNETDDPALVMVIRK